jgi:hypothetical protein
MTTVVYAEPGKSFMNFAVSVGPNFESDFMTVHRRTDPRTQKLEHYTTFMRGENDFVTIVWNDIFMPPKESLRDIALRTGGLTRQMKKRSHEIFT